MSCVSLVLAWFANLCLLFSLSFCFRLVGSVCSCLTNDEKALLGEVVGGDLEVEGSRASSYTAGDVVVGTVARAEPAAKVTSLANGNTAQMGADTWGIWG